jgi:hypothetical protein
MSAPVVLFPEVRAAICALSEKLMADAVSGLEAIDHPARHALSGIALLDAYAKLTALNLSREPSELELTAVIHSAVQGLINGMEYRLAELQESTVQ